MGNFLLIHAIMDFILVIEFIMNPLIKSNTISINNQDVVVDSVISKFPEIDSGVYYVKRVNDKQFKIASSVTNLYNDSFVSVSGIVTNNYFCVSNFYNKNLQHQKLYRQFKSPVNDGGEYTTNPGKTGMLVNGVEILNYKSGDSVYYGNINSVTVSAPGSIMMLSIHLFFLFRILLELVLLDL